MIDWTRLNALRADIGEEDFADVAILFVAEISEHLERLAAAPDTACAADFHFLRGSAANLGFTALTDACEAAEADCHAGQAPDLGRVLAIFAASLNAATPQMPELTLAA